MGKINHRKQLIPNENSGHKKAITTVSTICLWFCINLIDLALF